MLLWKHAVACFSCHNNSSIIVPLFPNTLSSPFLSVFLFLPSSEISYQLHLQFPSDYPCRGVERTNEGIEFAMRGNNSDGWIPLQFHFLTPSSSSNLLQHMIIRGYSLTATSSGQASITRRVEICGERLLGLREVQFRWMGSANFPSNGGVEYLDVWALSNVSATIFAPDGASSILFQDSFGREDLE